MRLSLKPFLALTALVSTVSAAEKLLKSSSLNTCQAGSSFTASLFNVVLTPANNSVAVSIVAVSSVQGRVVFDVKASAYGYVFLKQVVDPCTIGLAGLCPMAAGKLDLDFNLPISADALKQVPGIAYSVPDLDATVRVHLNRSDTGESVSCVEADISNGATVNLVAVKWATALIAGFALFASAIVSGLGHSNTAAHIASNALSLVSYFQSMAMLGLTGVQIPPIVRAWTQDFQWSMGIIKLNWMQSIFTWYQRATGGKPTELFHSLGQVSVQVEKKLRRSLDSLSFADNSLGLFKRELAMQPAATAVTTSAVGAATRSLAQRSVVLQEHGSYIVFGIQRVAFMAGIEVSNIFMTGITFFCVFVILTILGLALFKGLVELLARNGIMKKDRFLEFRMGWITVLKGILFRIVLIGYAPIVILCLWELTQRDSSAEVVLAIFFFLGLTFTLMWAAFKVILIARRSLTMHRNPAYILFSDPQALNKWGFLYVQFRASAYYYIVPVLLYLLIKGAFIAFCQRHPVVTVVSLIIIESGALIAASVMRPWMDKSTNTMNVAIHVMTFLNTIFLLIFSQVFGQPPIVTGVVGVVLFAANAIFALVLLLVIIASTIFIFFRKNPENKYHVMGDDRASFMKSNTQINTTSELDALAATARGDKGGYQADVEEDNDSVSSASMRRRMNEQPNMSAVSGINNYGDPRFTPSTPYLPANQGPPNSSHAGLNPGAGVTPYQPEMARASSPYMDRGAANSSPAGYRPQNNASPWQRGAGYDQ